MSKTSGNLYLYAGDDEYQVRETARKTVAKFVPAGEEALQLEIIEGTADKVEEVEAAVASCIEAVSTMGFFASGKTVWFRDVNFLTDAGAGRTEGAKKAIQRLVDVLQEGLPPDITLVVTANAVNRGRKFFKLFDKQGTTAIFNVPEKDHEQDQSAAGFIRDFCKQSGLKISSSQVQDIAARIGYDSRRLNVELEKLATYAGDKTLTDNDISAIVCAGRETAAWDLADALAERNGNKALNIFRQLVFQKESPIGMLIMLENRFRDMLLLRACIDQRLCSVGRGSLSWNDNATVLEGLKKSDPRKLHPYRAFKLAESTKGFSIIELRQIMARLAQTHEKIVSSSLPQEWLIEMLIIRICRRRGRRT